MRVIPRVGLLCLLALLLLAGADKPDGPPEWGIPVEGCRLSLATDKTQYSFGEPINIHVVIQNTDRHQLRVIEGQNFPYHVQVIGPKNDDSPLTLWGRYITRPHSGSADTIFLSKGQTKDDDFEMLNEAYDMTLPGKYGIIVTGSLPSETDPNASIGVISNTIIIEVKPLGAK